MKSVFKVKESGVYPTTENLLRAMMVMNYQCPSYDLLNDLRVNVERTIRNKAAHQLQPINEKWIRNETNGLISEEIMAKLWQVLCNQEGQQFGPEYRESYMNMNKDILNLLP